MTTDPRERLRRIDPSPVDAEPPSGAIEATAVIHEIERRMGMEPRETPDQPTITSSQQQQEAAPPPSAPDQVITAPQQRTPPGRRRPLLVGVGGVAAVLFVGAAALGIVAVVGDDAPSPVAAPTTTAAPVTTQPPPTTVVPSQPFTVDEALAVSDAYFAAYEAGDVDAMLALFAPDARFINGIAGSMSREDWEKLYVFKVAEGTVLTTRDCTATTTGSGLSTPASESAMEATVRCEYGHHEYLSRAVDGPVVPHRMTMVVTPAGVTRLQDNPGSPNFTTVGDPFTGWMLAQHPEDLSAVGCCGWDSVEHARQTGLLQVQFVDEWAAYLEANGCTYTDGC